MPRGDRQGEIKAQRGELHRKPEGRQTWSTGEGSLNSGSGGGRDDLAWMESGESEHGHEEEKGEWLSSEQEICRDDGAGAVTIDHGVRMCVYVCFFVFFLVSALNHSPALQDHSRPTVQGIHTPPHPSRLRHHLQLNTTSSLGF